MKSSFDKSILGSFPETPGVYKFYGANEVLLYVGKSKSLRSRIRAHFSAKEERRFMRGVKRIEVEETSGELGALLLESKYIKELRPLKNIAARRRRGIVIATRTLNKQGFAVVSLKVVDYWSVDTSTPALGLFKHKTQAMEFLSQAAKKHRLCTKLLKLEQPHQYCFAYHLGRCDGACMGEGNPQEYNARLEKAFEERRVKAWPFQGTIVVEETSVENGTRESFFIDNWCLIGSCRQSAQGNAERLVGQHRFDYDSYKILYSYLTDPRHPIVIRPATERESMVLPESFKADRP